MQILKHRNVNNRYIYFFLCTVLARFSPMSSLRFDVITWVRARIFAGQFVVRLPHHDANVAKVLASDHGMRLLDTALEDGYFHLHDARLPTVSSVPSLQKSRALASDPRVIWVAQQELKERKKRHAELKLCRGFNLNPDDQCITENATQLQQRWTFDDPFFSRQWYLVSVLDYKNINRKDKEYTSKSLFFKHCDDSEENLASTYFLQTCRHTSMFENGVHADEAWSQGFTGRGVTAFVLDDGVQKENEDIAVNYEPRGGADVSEIWKTRPQPDPRNIDDAHGTYCAAVIAGAANNAFCGVGVAFHSRVGGVKLLGSGPLSDLQEALALSLWQNIGDIASASWGPKDDGKSMEGPGPLASAALKRGVTQGRGGLGAVFVWAAGNGGAKGDNCNLDGYASSPMTLTVGALTYDGESCEYSEPCAAVMMAVPVSGPVDMLGHVESMVVPELNGNCRNNFQGTSAAAPLAAGLIALALQAAPSLTWREVQHAVVNSSKPTRTQLNGLDWRTNAAGRRFHPRQGFGVIHAGRLVTAALELVDQPLPQHQHVLVNMQGPPVVLRGLGNTTVVLHVPQGKISNLEHVVATVSLRHTQRRFLEIWIISPRGTESQVLTKRQRDSSTSGIKSWPFLSVHFWDEKPEGQWRIVVGNGSQKLGLLTKLELGLYGH